MARFVVVMTYDNGERRVLSKHRRQLGAVHEMEAHAQSKRDQLIRHAIETDRVIVGPDEPGEGEFEAMVVVRINGDEYKSYRYAVERKEQEVTP